MSGLCMSIPMCHSCRFYLSSAQPSRVQPLIAAPAYFLAMCHAVHRQLWLSLNVVALLATTHPYPVHYPASLLWHCHWASTDGSAFPFLPHALGNAMTYNLHGRCCISIMGCLGNMVAHTPESSIRTKERVRASRMAWSFLCLCLLGVPCLPRAVWRKYQPGKEEG